MDFFGGFRWIQSDFEMFRVNLMNRFKRFLEVLRIFGRIWAD